MNFFKRNDEKKVQAPERILIFKMNDGSWKQRFHIDGMPQTNEPLRKQISDTQKMYKENYAGAHVCYRFFIKKDEILEVISKFSYEQVWEMWKNLGYQKEMWGFKITDNEENNKRIIIMSTLFQFKPDKTLGTGNLELDTNLTHDFILISLADVGLLQNKQERLKALSLVEEMMGQRPLLKNEKENFNIIIDSMKT